MATIRVPTDYPTIAEAMSHVSLGDTIALDPGYSNETAVVSVEGLTVDGAASSLNIHLVLGAGIAALALTGAAPISVDDNSGANVISGNSGANVITVTNGADVVDGGAGNDRLVVDYSAATHSIFSPIINPIHTGTTDGYAGDFTDLLGGQTVAFDNIDSFNVRTGSAADAITTGGGNDTIEGGQGADQINGGAGVDFASYAHSSAGVTVDLSNNSHNAGGDAAGDILTGIEGVIGSAFNDALIGFADGRSAILAGGAGNDVYSVNNTADQVQENLGGGLDWVIATANYTIPTNVEALIMNGAGLIGTGSGGNDVLTSINGANTLTGLAGNDTFYVTNTGDVVNENANEGRDTVWASVNYTIPANVEVMYMYGSGLIGTGSAGNDYLVSVGGPNTLSGLGGDDVYEVGNSSDVVQESFGGGNDWVIAHVNYATPANVEALIMNGAGLIGTGSSGNDVLTSINGPNTLAGSFGNDAYYVTNTGDVVNENANEGRDTVWASVNYTIPANVEVLSIYGTGLIGTGSAGDELLASFGGGNVLVGNGGNDVFQFYPGQGGGSTITDFDGNGAGAGDQLVFVGYGPGATFTQIDSTRWQVDYNGGAAHDLFTFTNGASIHPSDFLLV